MRRNWEDSVIIFHKPLLLMAEIYLNSMCIAFIYIYIICAMFFVDITVNYSDLSKGLFPSLNICVFKIFEEMLVLYLVY